MRIVLLFFFDGTFFVESNILLHRNSFEDEAKLLGDSVCQNLNACACVECVYSSITAIHTCYYYQHYLIRKGFIYMDKRKIFTGIGIDWIEHEIWKKQILKLAHFTFPWLCRMCNTRFFVPGLTKHSFILSCTNCRTTILSFYQSTPTTEKGQTIPYLHQLRTSVGKSNNEIILSDYSTIAFLIEYTF